MNVQDYFEKLRKIRDTSMATVAADGMPRVRIIDTMIVEDEKLFFLTARGKDFYEELMNTGHVAVTGLNSEWETIRLWGKVKNIGRERLDEIFEKNPSMNGVYPGDSRGILDVFCLYEGEGEYIQCGTCAEVCPQGAVREGSPYEIVQENCLHCGLCFEQCPVSAINRRTGEKDT